MRRIMILSVVSLVLALAIAAGQAGEAKAPPAEDAGELVLLLSWRDSNAPGGVIRLTIENRGREPVRVIEPPNILTSGSWWGLGAYDIRMEGPDGNQQSYQCLYPPLPKPLALRPPKPVVLLPGRSVGALVDLHRKSAKPWAVENGKYTITATYDPADRDLSPFGNKKISSNALTWQVTFHPSATDCTGSGGSWPVVR